MRLKTPPCEVLPFIGRSFSSKKSERRLALMSHKACYIKTADADVVAAMRSLENAPNMHLESVKTSQRM
jgi:hypothetical protein